MRNVDGRTALHVAGARGSMQAVGLLVGRGADAAEEDQLTGATPLTLVPKLAWQLAPAEQWLRRWQSRLDTQSALWVRNSCAAIPLEPIEPLTPAHVAPVKDVLVSWTT